LIEAPSVSILDTNLDSEPAGLHPGIF